MKTPFETITKQISGQAKLCAVSKKHSVEEIMDLYRLGQRIFAENHAQELLEKAPLCPSDISWHFIGHLQKNKVRSILPTISCVQSVDSLQLIQLLEKECARIQKTLDITIELHLAENDYRKTGFPKEQLPEALKECEKCPHLHCLGLMVMGPHPASQQEVREVFQEAHQLYQTYKDQYHFSILSMGMSQDYTIALTCGSTMVRIGTYLFSKGEA